jgi:hypothetical protein
MDHRSHMYNHPLRPDGYTAAVIIPFDLQTILSHPALLRVPRSSQGSTVNNSLDDSFTIIEIDSFTSEPLAFG